MLSIHAASLSLALIDKIQRSRFGALSNRRTVDFRVGELWIVKLSKYAEQADPAEC